MRTTGPAPTAALPHGGELVRLALALTGAPSRADVRELTIASLYLSAAPGGWALLDRVGPGRYHATAMHALCEADLVGLLARACGPAASLDAVEGAGPIPRGLDGPHWQAGWSPVSEPEVVLACWTAPGGPVPDEPFLHQATQLVAGAMRSAVMIERLALESARDPLTGCLNRRGFRETLAREADRVARYGGDYSVLFLDLDRFKEINDRYGHAVGDEALRTVAERLRSTLRSSDRVGRVGGDEFVVLLPDAGVSAARRLAGRIRRAISADGLRVARETIRLDVSVGWASSDERVGGDLIDRADRRMLASKGGAVFDASPERVSRGVSARVGAREG